MVEDVAEAAVVMDVVDTEALVATMRRSAATVAGRLFSGRFCAEKTPTKV